MERGDIDFSLFKNLGQIAKLNDGIGGHEVAT
jgi:hypothetical protein